MALLYFGLRRNRPVPTKFEAAIQSLVEFVRDGIARDVIGPEGAKYVPYLLSIFMLILVGNLFEVTPLINFPITAADGASRFSVADHLFHLRHRRVLERTASIT